MVLAPLTPGGARRIPIFYTRLAADQSPETAPTLIVINGGPGEANYLQNLEKLFLPLRKHTNLVFYEQRGVGHSRLTLAEAMDCQSVNTVRNAEDLQALKVELSPDRPVYLLGHSYGGNVAVAYAGAHPDQVAKLVILNSGATNDFILRALNGPDYPEYYAGFEEYWGQIVRRLSVTSLERLNRLKQTLFEAAAENRYAANYQGGMTAVSLPVLREALAYALPSFIQEGEHEEMVERYFARLLEGDEKSWSNIPTYLNDRAQQSGPNSVINDTFLCQEFFPGIESRVHMKVKSKITGFCAGVRPIRCQASAPDYANLKTNIRARTLVVAGKNDPVMPLFEVRRLSEAIPGAIFKETDSAHLVSSDEEVGALAQILADFYRTQN